MTDFLESYFDSPISQARSEVIDNAVKTEFMINHILSYGFGLDSEQSKSFGKNSSALSFFNKVNLLIDFNFLSDKPQIQKIIKFSEIRNQFAHDVKVIRIDDCRQEILTFLKNQYNKHKITEKTYHDMYKELFLDIKQIVQMLFKTFYERANKFGFNYAKTVMADVLIDGIKELCLIDKDLEIKLQPLFQNAVAKIGALDPKDLIGKSNFL